LTTANIIIAIHVNSNPNQGLQFLKPKTRVSKKKSGSANPNLNIDTYKVMHSRAENKKAKYKMDELTLQKRKIYE